MTMASACWTGTTIDDAARAYALKLLSARSRPAADARSPSIRPIRSRACSIKRSASPCCCAANAKALPDAAAGRRHRPSRAAPVGPAALQLDGTHDFLFLHDLIEHNAVGMYRGYEILSTAAFRVTRNSNLYFQEEESRSLLDSVRSELHNRRKGDAVRLEIEEGADAEIVDRLRMNFELDDAQVFPTDGPVNLSRLMNLYTDTPRPDLKFKTSCPGSCALTAIPRTYSTNSAITTSCSTIPSTLTTPSSTSSSWRRRIRRVVSMKQTLYRTSSDSPMFHALTEAAADQRGHRGRGIDGALR